MSDEANVASNAASSEALPDAQVTTQVETVVADKPASSAREALTRAFAKVDGPALENAKPETGSKDDRPRDATGKFVPTQKDAVDAKAPEVKPDLVQADVKPPVITPDVPQAPERFTKAAKDAWAQTPEPVRAETARALGELTRGIEKYKVSADAYEPIRPFDEYARQRGGSLAASLQNMQQFDAALQQGAVPQAFTQLCQLYNLNPAAVGQALAGGTTQGQSETAALLQRNAQLEQQLASHNNKFKEFEQFMVEQRTAPINELINKASSEKPFFKLLEPAIYEILSSDGATGTDPGSRLEAAYDAALKQYPQLVSAIEAEKAAKAQPDPAQTRQKANLSITGSPSTGSNPTARKTAGSAREALQSAFSQVGL
jgi:hypothetical protein